MKEEENMPPFYIGQKVVGVNAPSGSRIKNGEEYTISDCHYSESGNPISPKGKRYWYVGVMSWPEHKWLTPKLFMPLQQMSIMTFSEIKEVEKEYFLINN